MTREQLIMERAVRERIAAELTTDHPASSYGIPVLVIEGDAITADEEIPGGQTAGAEYVSHAWHPGGRLPEIVWRYLVTSRQPTGHLLAVVGGALRTIRRACGLSQGQAAEQLGTTRNTVARWERGELELSSIARMGILRWARESR